MKQKLKHLYQVHLKSVPMGAEEFLTWIFLLIGVGFALAYAIVGSVQR